MKRHLLSFFAIAAMAFATSCTQDEIISQSTGDEVAVTFTTELRNDIKSRALGDDAHQINSVQFAVYGEDQYLSQLYQEVTPEKGDTAKKQDPNKMYATINVVLVKGQTYNFVFWAQTKSESNSYTSPYTFNPADTTLTINYQNANDIKADAFFAKVTNFTVSGTFEKTVNLKRPFAQVNFLTTEYDLEKAAAAGYIPSQSSLEIQNASQTLNLLSGKLTGNAKATFGLGNVIVESETITIKKDDKYVTCDANGKFGLSDSPSDAEPFRYLATAYFLPTADEATITASMKVTGVSGKAIDLTVAGIQARTNYRTNIYGNLLTSNGQFNVVVDPDSSGDNNVSPDEYTPSYSSLNGLLQANVDKTDALTYNVQTDGTGSINSLSIVIPQGTQAHSLTFNLNDLAAGAQIEVKNGANGNYDNPVIIEVPEDADLNSITINLPGAHVVLKQGTIENVISSTAAKTLEITAGTRISKLNVQKGNVRIATQAVVDTLFRSANNVDEVTFIVYEGSVPAEANADAKIKYVTAAEFDLFHVATYGGNVKLASDIQLTQSLVIAPSVTMTIDLNGHTIRQETEQAAAYSMIVNNGTLTIKDTKGNGKIVYADNAQLTAAVNYASNTIQNNGTLTIESGIVENNSVSSVAAHGYPHPIDNNAILTINGGTITNNANYSSMRIWCTTDDNTIVTINGGTFNGSIDFHNPNGDANKGTLTIHGGTFNADTYTNSAVRLLGFGTDVDEMNGYISGGTFNGEIKLRNYVGVEFNSQVFFISGGTFSTDVSLLVAEGYEAVKEGEVWTIATKTIAPGTVTPETLATTDFNLGGTFYLVGDFSGINEISITPTEGVETIIDATDATFSDQIIFKIPGRADSYTNVLRSNGRKGKYTLTKFNLKTLSVEVYGTELAVTHSTLESFDCWGGNTALDINNNTIDGKNISHTRYDAGTNEYGVSIAMMNYDLKFDGNTVTNTVSHVVGINGLTDPFNKDGNMNDATNQIVSFTGNTLSGISQNQDNRAGLKIWCDITYAPSSANSLESLPDAGKTLIETISKDSTNAFIKATDTTYKAYKFNFFDYSHFEL